MGASAAQPEQGEWASTQMHDEGGAIGTLHISQRSWREDWEQSEKPRLKSIDDEDECGRILFPILMPSSGRPQHALLDLSKQLLKRYVQIVCVKSNELDAYKSHWPELSFFELPSSAIELGIGASRHWIMRLAKLICAPDFPFCFMLDDNVEAWKGIQIGDDDPIFEQLFEQDLFEHKKNGDAGKKKDIRLETVLLHFQHDDFRADLAKFGLIGFDRLGYKSPAKFPFARRHVYKAIIVNLDVLRAANYKERVHVWEDLEFNLRISGGVREIREDKRLEYGGRKWLQEVEALGQEDGGAWMKDLIPPGPAVICKCYRFGFHQRKLPSGGVSGSVAKKIDPPPPPPPPPPLPPPPPKPVPPVPPPQPEPHEDEIRPWLSKVLRKATDTELDGVVEILKLADHATLDDLRDLAASRQINALETTLQSFGIRVGWSARIASGLFAEKQTAA